MPQAGQQMELHNFCFAYKNEPETLHIRESKIPANRIVGIIGNYIAILFAELKDRPIYIVGETKNFPDEKE